MRIGLLGGSGQLGCELQVLAERSGHQVLAPDSKTVDVRDLRSVESWVDECACDAYVNCAAFTQVDAAELDPDAAYSINETGARHVAETAGAAGKSLVYLSTDYVFDGSSDRPYIETDATNPLSVYGRSKLAGERATRASTGNHAVLRVSWVFGQHRTNFVKSILRRACAGEKLRVVNDQIGTPCSTRSIARAIITMLTRPSWSHDVYHFASVPPVTWHGFAIEIVNRGLELGLLSEPVEVEPVFTHELNQAARRPAYSVLRPDRFVREFGAGLADWSTELLEVLRCLRTDASGR